MIYLHPETHLPVDLPALLKLRGNLDLELLMNDKSRTRVRLLAAPVAPEIANLRRMKAKKESKGHNPSKAVLELMDDLPHQHPRPQSKLHGNPRHLRPEMADRGGLQGLKKSFKVRHPPPGFSTSAASPTQDKTAGDRDGLQSLP